MAEDICLGFGDWLGHVCDGSPEFRWLKQPLLEATSRIKECLDSLVSTSLLAN